MDFLKKAAALLWVLGMFGVFAACAGTAPAVTDSAEGEDSLIYVGFVQVGAESDWRIANTESMQEAFTEANGYRFEMVDCQQQPAKQITAIRGFIQKAVDYIVLAPNKEFGWDTVLGEVKEEGIPVIIVDRQIETNDDSLFTAWVGSDFMQEGYDAVTAIEKILGDKGITDADTVNFVTLQATIGSIAQIGRSDGFEEKAAAHTNWVMLDRQSGGLTQEKGCEVMESFLKSYDDIDVVISEDDNMSYGAIDAIEAAGKTCGQAGDIVLLSFGGGKNAFRCMADGTISVIVECNPLYGPCVESLIKDLEAGKTVDKLVYVTGDTFWPDNAEELLPTRF